MTAQPKHATPAAVNETASADSRISALLDGELDDATARGVLREVARNAGERARFRDYCRIGDALRGDGHDASRLHARVMAALEEEPTLLAPMRRNTWQRPALWLAAASVAAIGWGLWSLAPQPEGLPPMAAGGEARVAQAGVDAGGVVPYLAAHQDFAQAVVAPSEMRFTRVSLAEAGR